MNQYHAKLGIALDGASGPLTTEPDQNKSRFAVWPAYANGLLLVGSTGNGKSSLLRYMTTNLVRPPLPPQGIGVHLADGKFSGAFLMFRDVPGVVDIAGDPERRSGRWSAATSPRWNAATPPCRPPVSRR